MLFVILICGLGGAWRSLVAHLLWEQGVGGSNPLAPTVKPTRGCSSTVEPQPSKLVMGVRFPSPALYPSNSPFPIAPSRGWTATSSTPRTGARPCYISDRADLLCEQTPDEPVVVVATHPEPPGYRPQGSQVL